MGTKPSHTWGELLRNYRSQAGLTQTQFIDHLSRDIASLDQFQRDALESIEVYGDAVDYFTGILDSPTLSRLEKGNRTLNARSRCLAFIWALQRLDVLVDREDGDTFLELAGHGNLTVAEADVVFGQAAAENVLERSTSTVDPYGQPGAESSSTLTSTGRRRHVLFAAAGLALGVVLSMAALTLLSDNGSSGEPSSAGPSVQESPQGALAVHTLLVDELHSEHGEIGNDHSYANLHERDQDGVADDWPLFVKFMPDQDVGYVGYRAFLVPDFIEPSSIRAIRLEVNYRGPAFEHVPWVWESRLSEEVVIRLGDNRDTPWWGEWASLSFTFPETSSDGTAIANADYVQDGKIWVSLRSGNPDDGVDLDYEAIVVEWDRSAQP